MEVQKAIAHDGDITKEDEELQHRFWALFGPDKLKSPDLRIGAQYLFQNKDLLD